MDDLPAEGNDKRLNRTVAISVVVLSVFLGLCHIKDDNIVQAMQQAKADAVDTWGEYQATKTKLHITEGAADQLAVLGELAHDKAAVMAQTARLAAAVAKYTRELPQLQSKARGFEAAYDTMNYHDDQFDAADALVGIAISVAAVAALADSWWALGAAWVFGAFGVLMGLAGFAGWSIHPNFVAKLLS